MNKLLNDLPGFKSLLEQHPDLGRIVSGKALLDCSGVTTAPDGVFDVVVSRFPVEDGAATDALKRHVKPGGKLLIVGKPIWFAPT
jgi:hypothetical protein